VTLIDEHPAVIEVDKRLADLQRQKDEFEGRAKALAEEDAEAERKYDEARKSALLRGTPMPAPPVLQLGGADVELRQSFMLEQQLLTEERRQAVAAVYPEVLRQARSLAAREVEEARPMLVALADVMGRVGSLLAAVQTCRDAKNAQNPGGFRQFHDSRLTMATFIPLVATGGDPTSILDLPGAPRPQPSSRDGLTRADIQQLIDGGGGVQPAEESPVPQLAPVRTVGFAQSEGDDTPGQLGEDTPEQLADDSRSGQRVGA
jgi:hypothetical protein